MPAYSLSFENDVNVKVEVFYTLEMQVIKSVI
jgi:hypothetical protein